MLNVQFFCKNKKISDSQSKTTRLMLFSNGIAENIHFQKIFYYFRLNLKETNNSLKLSPENIEWYKYSKINKYFGESNLKLLTPVIFYSHHCYLFPPDKLNLDSVAFPTHVQSGRGPDAACPAPPRKKLLPQKEKQWGGVSWKIVDCWLNLYRIPVRRIIFLFFTPQLPGSLTLITTDELWECDIEGPGIIFG